MLDKILDFIRGVKKPAAPLARPRGRVQRRLDESKLDHDAIKIVKRLARHDHEAYLVGGCVRDALLDRVPKDYDIATSATPRQIKRLFRNSRIIGRRFKLAHVYFHGGKIIEVATFRAQDAAPADGDVAPPTDDDLMIRDDNVFGSAEDDAIRRDFTINALFYDVNGHQVIDHIGGLDDLDHRLIRAIGDPAIRFREDPIRILRAVKFAARLGFGIERDTRHALEATRDEIPRAAEPRILEEIYRFCRGGAAHDSFELLRETGVFDVILPDFARRYRKIDGAWDLFLRYLTGIDTRLARGFEVQAGEVLGALVMPLLVERFGWREGAEQPRGVNVRELVQEILEPSARSLRIARKDQEYCRQLCQALFRMVPLRRVRRSSRRGILHRDCFSAAVWMLEASAPLFGESFDEAAGDWKRAAKRARESGDMPDPGAPTGRRRRRRGGRGRRRGGGDADRESTASTGSEAAESKDAESTAESAGEGSTAPRKRRRGRRGGRGRKRGGGGDASDAGQRAPSSAEGASPAADNGDPERPKRWDDQYFFSALPTVPDLKKDDDPDRYGSERLTREPAKSSEPAVPSEPAKPKDEGSDS